MQPKAPCARCNKCPLFDRPFVPTYVPEGFDGMLFIGEAPGQEEVRKRIPFIGPSGQLLQTEYEKLGGKYESAARTNAVLCRPRETANGGWTPPDAAIAACAPRLRNEIKELAPTNIVTLGKVPARIMSVLAGKNIEEGVLEDNIIGAPHPAFILRKRSELPRLQRVLRRVLGQEDKTSLEVMLRDDPEVTVITTFGHLMGVLDSIGDNDWICFDIETNNLNWYDRPFNGPEGTIADSILCLAFTTGVGYGWIVPDYLIYDTEGVKEALSAFFKRVKTIAHNGKFDTIFLRANGIESHVDIDTLALHYALDETPGTHGLKDLAQAFYGVPNYEERLIKPYMKSKNDDYSKIPEEPLFKYAIWDVCATFALSIYFKRSLMRQHGIPGVPLWEQPVKSFYMPALNMLTEVEWRGIRVDVPSLQFWKERFHERADILKKKLGDIAGNSNFNPGSSVQCQKLLFDDLGLPMTKSAITARAANSQAKFKDGSTSRVVLEAQLKGAHPAVDMIIEYRALEHKISAYFDNLLENCDSSHRVHTQYLLQGTETGRLSARFPALQTIPRATTLEGRILRSCFIAAPGHVFIDADYDQAELRVFAALTMDPFLLRVYEDGRDLHNEVVAAMYGPKESMDEFVYKERRMAIKMFNFGWAFGAGLERAKQILPDPVAAEEFYNRYEAQMPVAAAWRRRQTALADNPGFVVSRTGRKRRFPERGYGPEAINAPVQVGASDCTIASAIRLNAELHRVLLLVHDELIVEVPYKERETMLHYVEQVMAEEGAKLFPEVKWNAEGKWTDRWTKQLTDQEINDWMVSGGLAEESAVLV